MLNVFRLKKIIVIMTVLLTLLVSGCSSNLSRKSGPSSAVDKYLKNNRQELAKTAYLEISDGDIDDYVSAALEKQLIEMIASFKYSIAGEEMHDDWAYVQVKIQTYNFGRALTAMLIKMAAQSLKLYYSGGDEKQAENLYKEIFNDTIKDLKKSGRSYTGTVDILVEKENGVWTVNEKSIVSAIVTLLLGGALTGSLDHSRQRIYLLEQSRTLYYRFSL